MTVPTPKRPLPAPVRETIGAGAVLFRCHEGQLDGAANPGNVFNPGFGGRTRWAFFGEPDVPVLYAGQSPQAAAFETVFHDIVPGSVVPGVAWRTKLVTALRVTRTLRLAALHSAGLRRYGLHGRDLTDTPAESYGATVGWAEAVHDDTDAAGLVWMSRQFNTDRAYVFFGDRVTPDDLVPDHGHQGCRDFSAPDDADWLRALANQIDVTVMG